MSDLFSRIERYGQAIKNWWLTLLLGIAVLIAGILVFMYPGESYLALSIFFGLMIVFSGLLQIFVGCYAPKGSGRGWLIAGGIIELILGAIICCNLAIAASILPFMLGFWLLFKGITVAVLASDMGKSETEGRGWVIFLSVLLIISAILVLIFPLIGVGAIILWLGISFILAGISFILLSFRLRSLKKHFNK